jgi:molybdopterin converting factor small subunit
MPLTFHIPVMLSSPLRDYAGGVGKLSVSAVNVRAALEQIEQLHPRLYGSVCDETGAIRRHVNVFVNSSNIRDLDGPSTALSPGDVLTILPSVSGG